MLAGDRRIAKARLRLLLGLAGLTRLCGPVVEATSRAGLGFGDLSFFDQLLEFRAALDQFECALFLDDLGSIAGVVAASANGFNQAGALHAAAEFANSGKRRFAAAFLDFCVYGRHVAKSLPHAWERGN